MNKLLHHRHLHIYARIMLRNCKHEVGFIKAELLSSTSFREINNNYKIIIKNKDLKSLS